MGKIKVYDVIVKMNEFLDRRELHLENIRLMIKREINHIKNLRNVLEAYDEKSGQFQSLTGFSEEKIKGEISPGHGV